jgi:hypothetical protein
MIRQIYEIINIFSASMPYYAQVKKFQQTKNSEGYSTYVSLLVISSSILKIFFWFGKYYHWSLLLQAILITLTHFWLVYESVKYKNCSKFKLNEPSTLKEEFEFIASVSEKSKDEEIFSSFFNWNQIQLYAIFVIIYVFSLGGLCYNFGFDNYYFIESLGFINVFIEGSLGVPQVVEINKTKNVDNISVILIFSWFIGDFLKTYYFIVSNSPFQFLLLGLIQVLINCVIVYQWLKYKK